MGQAEDLKATSQVLLLQWHSPEPILVFIVLTCDILAIIVKRVRRIMHLLLHIYKEDIVSCVNGKYYRAGKMSRKK